MPTEAIFTVNEVQQGHRIFGEALFTVNEAAEQLRLSPWTLWDLLKRGELVRTKVCGKTFLRESELRKLIRDKVNARNEEETPRSRPRRKVAAAEAKVVR